MKGKFIQSPAIILMMSCFVWLLVACQGSPDEIIVTRVVTSVAQEIVFEPTTVIVLEVTATAIPTAVPTETSTHVPTPTATITPTLTATPNLPTVTDSVQLIGHEGGVNSIQFSPDGQLVLAASDDGTARLWDLAGNLLATFAGHGDRVTDAIFSPDGSLVVTSSDDKTARIWSVDGRLLHVLDGHSSQVNSALFTPDGRFIITNAIDPKIWDSDGNLLETLVGHRSRGVKSWISPNGNYLLVTSDDSSAFLWEIQRDGQVTLLADLEEELPVGRLLEFASFFPDNQRFLMNSMELQLWGISFDGEVSLITGSSSYFKIQDVHYAEDKILVLDYSNDGSVTIRDSLDFGNELPLAGHSAAITTTSFSEDGKYVLTGSADHTARIWNLEGDAVLLFSGHDAPIQIALFSADQKYVVTGDESGVIYLWNASSLEKSK